MSYKQKLDERKADISVFYKKVGNLELPLCVYLPENFDETKQYPAVLCVHGGSWGAIKETPKNWDGSWMAGNAKYYAEKGFVGIVFTYRDIKYEETTNVGDILADVGDAVSYIKQNMAFVEDERIILMGDSAGGHIVLSLALSLPDGKPLAIRPMAIVAYNPVTDTTAPMWSFCAAPGEHERFSPMHNCKKIAPKILVMHGTNDSVVPIADSREFVRKMKGCGNDIELIEIEGAEHAFILFGYREKEENIIQALKLTNKYLGL